MKKTSFRNFYKKRRRLFLNRIFPKSLIFWTVFLYWFNFRKLQIRENNALADKEWSNDRLKEAEHTLKLLKASFCVKELSKVEADIRSIDEAIAKADSPAKEILQKLHAVGAALYTYYSKEIFISALDRIACDYGHCMVIDNKAGSDNIYQYVEDEYITTSFYKNANKL